MKIDWSFRWWDLVALVGAVIAAVLVVQLAVMKSGTETLAERSAVVVVRVPQPLPELVNQLSNGDPLLSSTGEQVAEIFSVQPVVKADETNLSVPLFGKQDLLITLRVNGALRLVRDMPGFPKEPAPLKSGVWCLISTPKVELSGLVVKVSNLVKKPERKR